MTDILIQKLHQFGLTNKEASVYTAMLMGGEMTADEIAKQAKLNRSTTYVQLQLLMDEGLATTFKRGKKTFFAPESPRNLERIIDKKIEVVEQQKAEVMLLVPELLRAYGTAGERPVVRIFQGKEGLTSMRNDMLETNPKLIQVAFSYDGMRKIFCEAELEAFSKKRAGKKINSQALYTKIGDDIIILPPQKLKRISSKEYPFSSDVYIYGDTVSYATTQDQIFGITIKNSSIADTMRTLFEIAWKYAD